MSAELDQLLSRYDGGHISRRELLGVLSALVVAAPAAAAAEPAVGAVTQMNHVTVFVQNVQKSMDFYQGLFGMPLLTVQDAGMNLKAGAGFLGLFPAPAGQSGINHVCFGIENFDADAVLRKLADRGVKGFIRLRGETKELYFNDPDNVRVQLQDVRYIGGTGVQGDRAPR